MATRFYYESNAISTPNGAGVIALPIAPAFDGSWEANPTVRRYWLTTDKWGTDRTELTASSTQNTGTYDVAIAQFISAPLAAQTIDGNVKGQIQARESAADADLRAQIVIRVVSNDGTSVIGTLLASDAAALSSEWNNSSVTERNAKFPLAASSPATLTSTAVSAGDRLVVEIGYRAHNTLNAARTGTLAIGSAGSSGDLAENETETTATYTPWLEFSDTITFDGPDGVVLPRASESWVEAITNVANPHIQMTELWVEAVFERDYLYIDGILLLDKPENPPDEYGT
jgi:hypothetical protein